MKIETIASKLGRPVSKRIWVRLHLRCGYSQKWFYAFIV